VAVTAASGLLPQPVMTLLASLAVVSFVLACGYLITTLRARQLAGQRAQLAAHVGLLQTALLPPVPTRVGGVATSVAYRPADGPAAGGDFYDALDLPGGRSAFIVGDVCGHGHQALAQTAFVRYTLRAYLEAGLQPREALQVGGAVIDEHMAGEFATVVLAVHDPDDGSLTYACAGHPAPIVMGPSRPEPILVASAPPVGLGLRTGLRQTTLPLPAGSVVCLYTDGLAEARTQRGILGRPRLGDLLGQLGHHATAQKLLDRVAQEARRVTDDMATMILTPVNGITSGRFRVEQLEMEADELRAGLARVFLTGCGLADPAIDVAVAECRQALPRHGRVLLEVTYGVRGPTAQVVSGSGPTRTSIFPVF
jgi:Stage II sporulation protein E (SpoIIE)